VCHLRGPVCSGDQDRGFRLDLREVFGPLRATGWRIQTARLATTSQPANQVNCSMP
jgi:hypothetical protein